MKIDVFEQVRCQEATWAELGATWVPKRLQNGSQKRAKTEQKKEKKSEVKLREGQRGLGRLRRGLGRLRSEKKGIAPKLAGSRRGRQGREGETKRSPRGPREPPQRPQEASKTAQDHSKIPESHNRRINLNTEYE